ncbi:hypothetical protein [Bacillus sp. FJAT-27445]|uniref:hypothetical protein n=1 Tax=Bacillus sp. FJAT-27445 TaxID=1679166 RepID=UPI0007443C87|nr:hypothetical protein [Bacillus sp. FJAT-27445]
MTRYEMRHMKPKRINVYKLALTFTFLLICMGLMLGFSRYAQSKIKIEAPEVYNGKKVIVVLPNGHKVYTFENLIVEEDGKLLYKGERNTLDLTGGKVEFKEW